MTLPLRCRLGLHRGTSWNVVTFMGDLVWFYAEYCSGCKAIVHRYVPALAFAPNITDIDHFMLRVTGHDAEAVKDILAKLLDGHVRPRNIIPMTKDI